MRLAVSIENLLKNKATDNVSVSKINKKSIKNSIAFF
jgi:hypothetical protein